MKNDFMGVSKETGISIFIKTNTSLFYGNDVGIFRILLKHWWNSSLVCFGVNEN